MSGPTRAPPSWAWPIGSGSCTGTIARSPASSTGGRVDRHAGASSVSRITVRCFAGSGHADARRTYGLVHSIGRMRGPARPPLDPQAHLPGRLHSGPIRGVARDRAQAACGSATSRSCGCITPDAAPLARAVHGQPRAGRPTVRRAASAGCGNTTGDSEISFRYLDNYIFQVQLARTRDAVPLTRDYIQRPSSATRRWPARAASGPRLARTACASAAPDTATGDQPGPAPRGLRKRPCRRS